MIIWDYEGFTYSESGRLLLINSVEWAVLKDEDASFRSVTSSLSITNVQAGSALTVLWGTRSYISQAFGYRINSPERYC
jgi:hypothetical protein